MNIRLIAMDLDDTFLHRDKSISRANLAAVREAIAQGITVVPASGRSLHILPREMIELDDIRYLITANGARVRDLRAGRCLYSNLIPYCELVALLELADRYGAVIEVCLDEMFYITADDEEKEFSFFDSSLQWFIRSMHTIVPDLMEKVRECHSGSEKLVLMFPDRENLSLFRREAEEQFGVSVSSSLSGELEVTAKGVNKGAGLLALADHLDIAGSDIMALGDSENDADMLRAAGFSVAMGNANEELKALADAVTDVCDKDGVAAAIRRWALK